MLGGSVVRSVSIDAPISDAFDAVTRVAEMLSWLCEGALVGLREGGNWAVGFTDVRGRTEATVLGKIGQPDCPKFEAISDGEPHADSPQRRTEPKIGRPINRIDQPMARFTDRVSPELLAPKSGAGP